MKIEFNYDLNNQDALFEMSHNIQNQINAEYYLLLEKALDANKLTHPSFNDRDNYKKKKKLKKWIDQNIIIESSDVNGNYKISKMYDKNRNKLLTIVTEKLFTKGDYNNMDSSYKLSIDIRHTIHDKNTGEAIKE